MDKDLLSLLHLPTGEHVVVDDRPGNLCESDALDALAGLVAARQGLSADSDLQRSRALMVEFEGVTSFVVRHIILLCCTTDTTASTLRSRVVPHWLQA